MINYCIYMIIFTCIEKNHEFAQTNFIRDLMINVYFFPYQKLIFISFVMDVYFQIVLGQ